MSKDIKLIVWDCNNYHGNRGDPTDQNNEFHVFYITKELSHCDFEHMQDWPGAERIGFDPKAFLHHLGQAYNISHITYSHTRKGSTFIDYYDWKDWCGDAKIIWGINGNY